MVKGKNYLVCANNVSPECKDLFRVRAHSVSSNRPGRFDYRVNGSIKPCGATHVLPENVVCHSLDQLFRVTDLRVARKTFMAPGYGGSRTLYHIRCEQSIE